MHCTVQTAQCTRVLVAHNIKCRGSHTYRIYYVKRKNQHTLWVGASWSDISCSSTSFYVKPDTMYVYIAAFTLTECIDNKSFWRFVVVFMILFFFIILNLASFTYGYRYTCPWCKKQNWANRNGTKEKKIERLKRHARTDRKCFLCIENIPFLSILQYLFYDYYFLAFFKCFNCTFNIVQNIVEPECQKVKNQDKNRYVFLFCLVCLRLLLCSCWSHRQHMHSGATTLFLPYKCYCLCAKYSQLSDGRTKLQRNIIIFIYSNLLAHFIFIHFETRKWITYLLGKKWSACLPQQAAAAANE